jgi:rhodanese-related sulfurtransferase
MTIKSIQTLVSEAMQEIKTINADEALKMVEEDNCNLIDIREVRELESTGKVENSVHIPRGMLEIYLDPNSALFQQGVLDKNKETVLFCAGGVRSALAVKALKNMGYEKISHIEGGFGSISHSKFKIV